MKRFLEKKSVARLYQFVLLVLALGFSLPFAAQAAQVALATSPLTQSVTTDVLPNLMFVLDDSGSMDWDYMPDPARNFAGNYGFNSSQCNGTYYDPNVTYNPPKKSDGTDYPNADFSAAWRDGYKTGDGTVNLNTGFTGGSGTGASGINLTPGPAFYYTYSGTQTTAAQKDFKNTNSIFYRECDSAIGSTTQVDGSHPVNTLFTKTRLASTPTTTITVSGASGATGATITINSVGQSRRNPDNRPSVTSIKVGATELMANASAKSTSVNTVASNIAAQITQNGYSATVSSNVITIVGPAAAGATLALTYTGTMNYASTAFPAASPTTVSSITVGGTDLLSGVSATGSSTTALASDIRNKISATGYSATVLNNVVTITGPASASTYTPVITVASGTMTLATLPFPESTPAKLQNFANWYSYYSTRMLMMKTAAGRAFSDSSLARYRIGFMTMNNNVSPGFLDVAPFVGGCDVGSGTCQKDKWYTKLYTSNPGGYTPLRDALSHVGQYYANKFGTITTYSATITVGGSGSTSVEGITVGGVETMADGTPATTSTGALAASIAAQINAPEVTDFGARVSGNVITITGPASAVGQSPVVSKVGNMTLSTTAFTARTTTSQLNDATPSDPVQYSCQQNFTILSTDGFWNAGSTYDLANQPVGQQDGAAPRPMLDGASSTYTITTPYTTVQRRQAVTTGVVTTKTWSRTTTAIGAACSAPPAGATTYPLMDNNRRVGLGLRSTIPDTNCLNLGGTGAGTAWLCRGTGSSTDNPNNGATQSTVTDSTGKVWYLVDSGANAAGCVSNRTAFGSGYSTTEGACPGIAGSNVTTTTSTQTETISGATSTSLDDYTATQTTTKTVTNGVPGPEGALTPASPVYGPAVNFSTASTPPTSDTCAGQNGLVTPCPNTGGAWTNTVSAVCTATGSLPAPGTTTPVVTATSSTPGSVATTVISTVTTPGTPTQSAVTTTGGTSNTLADVAMYYYQTDLRAPALSNCTGALGNNVCENNVFSSANDNQSQQHMTTFTLGLGATGRMVYSPSYVTDTSGDFKAVKDGCTAGTATVGTPCGTQTSGTVCSWQGSGTTCNWPTPSSGALENIDDLWHAAVNGRGSYFSATNPTTLASGLSNALAGIVARKGAAAAAATSTLNPVAGNNYAYVASYTSVKWTGNLEARGINTVTGVVGRSAMWCAEDVPGDACPAPGTIAVETGGNTSVQYCVTPNSVTCPNGILDNGNCKVEMVTACNGTMNARVSIVGSPAATTTIDGVTYATPGDDRLIYTANDAGTGLTPFNDAFATAHSSYFNAASLSQWASLSSAKQTAASGVNLLRYLRGQKGLSDSSDTATDGLYRYRNAVLGDALESLPAYLASPVFSYPYPGYSDFVTAQNAKTAVAAGTVYIGTNDGMMHAFNATNGQERWAYVPSMVIPNMWRLADRNYATNHFNYVNGNAITSDICTANCSNADYATTATTADDPVWKTILVGGLNGGGRGYYALDITDPASPSLLWEISPSTGTTYEDIGYSFGQPVIARKADGTWVVLVTSGYNNTSPGTGGGYLYVLNAATGAIISKIPTGVGDGTTPSGLAKIAAFNDEPAGNQTTYVYGGDLQGNLWRFDIGSTADATGTNAIGKGAVLQFAILKDPSGVTQPITTTPVLGKIVGKRVVFIGTGKYLETADLTTTQVQTQYGIKDDDATATLNNPRSVTGMKQQTLTPDVSGSATRNASNNAVDFSIDRGWYVDLPESKERVNIDGKLVMGTLLVPSLVPENSECNPAGHGWLNFFNYLTGGAVDTAATLASTRYDSPIVGVNVLYIAGKPVVEVVTSTQPTPTIDPNVKFGGGAANFSGKRVIWRELIP
jgi:Tfp pilus tip-associated adhesin PilY1